MSGAFGDWFSGFDDDLVWFDQRALADLGLDDAKARDDLAALRAEIAGAAAVALRDVAGGAWLGHSGAYDLGCHWHSACCGRLIGRVWPPKLLQPKSFKNGTL